MEVDAADFSGWATKANLKCSDGRTISPDAFKHQDQETVPLVWYHARNEPGNILGHALLEHRPEGVYCYGFFNDTDSGQRSRILVEHKDITRLSIFANDLIEKPQKIVMHGQIREVSLVPAGANPGARIDFVRVQHSDDPNDYEDLSNEAVIYTGLELEHSAVKVKESVDDSTKEIEHAEDDTTIEDVVNSFNEEQKNVLFYLIGQALTGPSNSDAEHSDNLEDGTSIQAVLETLNEEQGNVFHYLLGQTLEYVATNSKEEDSLTADEKDGDTTAAHADNKEGKIVTTRNLFEQNAVDTGAASTSTGTSLTHAQKTTMTADIFKLAQESEIKLSAAVARYASSLEHGIENIDVLFPDARAVMNTPEFLARRTEWVSRVLGGTRHVPFSKIKSLTANLTLDEARAKGYVKGNLKKEEFFSVSKRETMPQTIYKKQQLDRDDILDITDFDVVVWIKGEMRLMLDEELARAILLGDGRDPGDEDKIREDRIRPISTDNDLYVTRIYINLGDTNSSHEEIIDSVVENRQYYRGTGNPVMFTSESVLSKMLLIKDTLGRRIYPDVNALKVALRVSDIIPVEVMGNEDNNVLGIIVNLQDYVVGADKGGDVALFDDFDIDYNKYKYLIETRCSGALVKAKSALVVLRTADNAVLATPVEPGWNSGTHTVTVATTTGVVYKNKDTGATLTTGAPVTLTAGQELRVEASAASGYYIPSDANDEYLFTYEDGPVNPGF